MHLNHRLQKEKVNVEKIFPRTDKSIIKNIKMNQTKTCSNLQRYSLATDFDVSVSTVHHRLLESGRKARTPTEKQYLNARLIKKSLT